MLLLFDSRTNDPMQQLQFNTIEDVDFFLQKVQELKKYMQIDKEEREREEKERWVER